MMLKTLAFAAASLAGLACFADSWELPQIKGNAPNVWNQGRNWTWDKGNPMDDSGAKWFALLQGAPEETFKAMAQGKAYNFNFVWRDDSDSFDPAAQYKEFSLSSASFSGGAGQGAKSAIAFAPPKAGSFKVELKGAFSVQNPSAGNALFSIEALNQDLKPQRVLKSLDVGSKGGYGSFPDSVEISESFKLEAGEILAFSICSVNPGPASSGKSSVSFKKLSITQE